MTIQLAPRIVVDSETRFGKPIIEGTRVPVETVLARISGGLSLDEVAAEYDLEHADILAGQRQPRWRRAALRPRSCS